MTETITAADIIKIGKSTSLTSTVLAQWAEKGTPKQLEYLHGLLLAEQQSRHNARTARLLLAAKLPMNKSLDGYDWTSISFPDSYGREDIRSLDFLDSGGDLVDRKSVV